MNGMGTAVLTISLQQLGLIPRSKVGLGMGIYVYRIAGKFGVDLNLAVWRSGLKPPN